MDAAEPTPARRCPACSGRRTSAVFAHTGVQSIYIPFRPCPLCNGLGLVTDLISRWHTAGRAHRAARIARMESLGECARRLGMSVVEISNMECGRADPDILAYDDMNPTIPPPTKPADARYP